MNSGLLYVSNEIVCKNCHTYFGLTRGVPILIDDSRSVFKRAMYESKNRSSDLAKSLKGNRWVPSASVNLSFSRMMERLHKDLKKCVTPSILVVGAGLQGAKINNLFSSIDGVKIICVDIDVASDVSIIADAHNLPFLDSQFDAVITTAVLEHVVDPVQVVNEIWRVLKFGRYVYSEIPFMQQVHEGAYDFTRFTAGGHRRLFKKFEEIELGAVAGPGTALSWSIEYFLMSFLTFKNKTVKKLAKLFVRMLSFWFKYFDFVFPNRLAILDGASCTYFYGTKSVAEATDSDIISKYAGDRHFRHV
jgi:ubiquinone/menaquinone biosynthesis C-methylase UbiE